MSGILVVSLRQPKADAAQSLQQMHRIRDFELWFEP
jgi:hypothetical protein